MRQPCATLGTDLNVMLDPKPKGELLVILLGDAQCDALIPPVAGEGVGVLVRPGAEVAEARVVKHRALDRADQDLLGDGVHVGSLLFDSMMCSICRSSSRRASRSSVTAVRSSRSCLISAPHRIKQQGADVNAVPQQILIRAIE